MSKVNKENGTIEVVLKDGKSFKTFGGIKKGGGEWLSRQLNIHLSKGVKKTKRQSVIDKFYK